MASSAAQVVMVSDASDVSVGAYLRRAAQSRGLSVNLIDMREAYTAHWLVRGVVHRWCGDYPLKGERFNRQLKRLLKSTRPQYMVTVGKAPVFADTLRVARECGTVSLNYSTDDPWNRRHAASWFFDALREYDVAATPRAATIADFYAAGVRSVGFLPFAYCPQAHRLAEQVHESASDGDVFFAGGCDADRLPYLTALIQAGIRPLLYGGFWNHPLATRRYFRGLASLEEMSYRHAMTPISLCLVRRANRDAHVMRTYEAAAMGGCLVVEDTIDHRALFGPDGLNVVYFSTPDSLVDACRRVLADTDLRRQLRKGAREVVLAGKNSYADRLDAMLAMMGNVRI